MPKFWKIVVFAAIVVFAIAFAVIFFASKRISSYTALCCLLSSVMISAALASSYYYFDYVEDSFEKYYYNEHDIEAVVVSERYNSVNLSEFDIIVYKIDGEDTYHKAVMDCSYGSVLEPGFSFCAKVSGFPFSDTFGSYNKKLAMHSDKVFILYESYDENTVFITDENTFHPTVFFAKINKGLSSIFRQGLDKDTAAMSSALFLGNKSELSNTVTRDFTRAGASHILALSGMHMSIIMGLLMLVMKKLGVRPKIIAVLLTLCALFYLFLTGVPISAARSVIMLLCVYLSMLCGSNHDSLTALSVAGVLLMLIFPGSVIDAGFWMSYSATLGLLVYLPAFNHFINTLIKPLERFKILLKPVSYILSAIMASVFATVPLIVVLCVFIRQISLYSIVSSVILAIPSSAVILLSLLYLAFSTVPFIGVSIAKILTLFVGFMADYCAQISDIENVVISINYPFAFIAAIVIGLTLIYSLTFKNRNLFISLTPFAISILLFAASIFIYNMVEADNVKVSYVNSSSRSDMLVVSNGCEAIICDIGNGSGASYYAALPSVYDARATEVKAIILTRYTHAHSGTLYSVFTEEKVRELWIPKPTSQDDYHKMVNIVDLAERFGVDVCMYDDDDYLRAFDYTSFKIDQYYIERSVVPVSIVSVKTRTQRLTYCSPAFNECEEIEEINKILSNSEYVIFGNCGPKTKTEYTIPEDNDAELIIFCDEIRAGYYSKDNVDSVTFALVEDRCYVKMRK